MNTLIKKNLTHKLVRSEEKTFITPKVKKVLPQKTFLVLEPELEEPSLLNTSLKELKVFEFELKEVKGESIPLSYKFLIPKSENCELNWEGQLPNDVPLLLEILVGRVILKIELPCSYMEKSKCTFRRASDTRGYNDTYIPTHWSVKDICFYLRTLILGYVVDNHPLGEYLPVWKAVVLKYELLTQERFSLLTGSTFDLSNDDKDKYKVIQQMEELYVL